MSKTIMENYEVSRLPNRESNCLTRTCIQEALVILMAAKPFDKITVTEIVKKAGVSRTSYYTNYKSKEDVLETMVAEAIGLIRPAMRKYDYQTKAYDFWYTMFKSLTPYVARIKLLVQNGFAEKIEDGIYVQLMSEYRNPSDRERYVERSWSAAVCAVIKQWTMENGKIPAEEMARICTYIEGK